MTTRVPGLPFAASTAALRRGRRRRATASVIVAGLVALVALTGCQTKAGAAATVVGDRIESSEVDRYTTVPTSTPAPSPAAGADSQTLSAAAKEVLVLNSLIDDKLYDHALELKGGPPTDAELADALTQGLAGETEADLTAKIVAAGLPASFEPVYTKAFQKKIVFVNRVNATTEGELDAAVAKLNIPVAVSGRYGSWSPSTVAVVGYIPPPFLRPAPTAAPDASGGSGTGNGSTGS